MRHILHPDLLVFIGFILCIACGACTPAPAVNPNLLLISIDTLGAQHLGCYGNPQPVTPALDRLSRRGVLFSASYSTAATTAPSHMSIMTGLHPAEHGVRNWGSREGHQLAGDITTLAEYLHANGYHTTAFTGGGNVAAALGFARGFDKYHENDARLDRWIDQSPREPFFVFVHTFEVHDPYIPPDPWWQTINPDYNGPIKTNIVPGEDSEFLSNRNSFWLQADLLNHHDIDHLRTRYRGSLRFVDSALEIGLRKFTAQNLERPLWIVFTADHGEEFGEHGSFLHRRLYEETIRVPLIMVLPPHSATAHIVPDNVQSIDILPTLLKLLKIEPLIDLPGADLEPVLVHRKPLPDRTLFAETFDQVHSCMILHHGYKYLTHESLIDKAGGADPRNLPTRRLPPEELYYLPDDPGEYCSIHTASPNQLLTLKRTLNQTKQQLVEQAQLHPHDLNQNRVELDDENRKRLESLGYLQ